MVVATDVCKDRQTDSSVPSYRAVVDELEGGSTPPLTPRACVIVSSLFFGGVAGNSTVQTLKPTPC